MQERVGHLLGGLALFAVIGLGLSLAGYKVKSLDAPLHLTVGKYIVEEGKVPKTDIFSFSRAGAEYVDAQWFFQVVIYTAYRLGGEAGLTLFMIALFVSLLLLLLFSAPPKLALSLRALAGAVFILGFNLRLLCRPELLSCFWMALMFFALERARRGRNFWLVLPPLAQLGFVNSEGIWPIGLGIVGAYAVDLGLERRKAPGFSWRRPLPLAWLLMGMAVLLACFCQPYGLRGLWFPWELLREITLPHSLHQLMVSEADPVSLHNLIHPTILGFVVFELLVVIVTLSAWRRLRPGFAVLGLVFLYFGFSSVRNISLACTVHLPLLLVHLEPLSRKIPKALEQAAGLAAIGLALFFSGLSLRGPVRTWDHTLREPGFGFSSRVYPVGAATFLTKIDYEGNLMNDDSVGGWLLWKGWPKWKVFADTRLEVGGEDTLRLYNLVFTDLTAFKQTTEKYHAEAAVLYLSLPHLREMALLLAQDPDWALVFAEPPAAVFLRRLPKWEQVIKSHELRPR